MQAMAGRISTTMTGTLRSASTWTSSVALPVTLPPHRSRLGVSLSRRRSAGIR